MMRCIVHFSGYTSIDRKIITVIPKVKYYAPGGNKVKKIVAAFQGMHVSPAKHSFGKCGRKCDCDRRTDGQMTDKVIPMCRYASQTQKATLSIMVTKSLSLASASFKGRSLVENACQK